MPQISGPSRSNAPPHHVADAIARASSRTGTDFGYMVAQARIESGFDPAARASTSSAAGLYQFTGQTWLSTLRRHGAAHGYGWASAAISGGGAGLRVADPALRRQVMDLRFDPQAASLMAGELARDNAAHLRSALGREPDSDELYLAHFLGAGGATRFLAALASDPNQSAAGVLPEAAGANPAIFRSNGRDRSVAEVDALLSRKLAGAGAGTGTVLPHRQDLAGPVASADMYSARLSGPAAMASRPAPAARGTMAQVVAATFGEAGMGDRASRHVAAAYTRLSGAGL